MKIKCIIGAALISDDGATNPTRASVTWLDTRKRLGTVTRLYPCPLMMTLLLRARREGVAITRETWR